MMEIVIKIDENLYTRLFDNGVDNYGDAVDMAKAICKGTPLPEHHGRLIDADAIDTSYSDPEVRETLDDAPTIIEGSESE